MKFGRRIQETFGPPLSASAYGDTLRCARELLGRVLIHIVDGGILAGRIVETEAYGPEGDPACHTFRKKTPRNAMMFEAGGVAYVYFTYGNHWCLNAVSGPEGVGEAVLIRAVEPLMGIDVMRERRGLDEISQLCSGPGKLTQALGISKAQNGANLSTSALRILEGTPVKDSQVATTTRIGISAAQDRLWRFVLKDSPFLSRAYKG
jgi:DNA-3-methyladenine glycosylase